MHVHQCQSSGILYTLAHLTEPSLMLLATPVLDKSKCLPLERSIEELVLTDLTQISFIRKFQFERVQFWN